jgi:hypothetical protein
MKNKRKWMIFTGLIPLKLKIKLRKIRIKKWNDTLFS